MSERRIAICDLGSNSFRLVVFSADGHHWRRTDEIYEPVRIGAGLAETGRLSRTGIERGLATVEVFAHFCRSAGITEIDAIATSAIRDASNSARFLKRSALPVRVASTEEEARYGYLAAVNSTTLADGAVLDLGGGSMQLVRVASRHDIDSGSWALGAVRMMERFALGGPGPASRRQIDKARDHVARALAAVPWLGRGERIVGIGGTVRNLAAAVQRAQGVPEFGVQGFCLTRDALGELTARLARMDPLQRGRVPGIKPDRGDLILAGAIVVGQVLESGGLEALEVTEAGLREGVFFAKHLSGDPPLFDDVRRQSVLNLASWYDVDPPHTRHVAELALSVFDQLAAAGLHRGDANERELLWSAAVLHDIGMAIDYDDHHKHSRYLVLNSNLPGFSQREVALIGQAVRYHRKGIPTLGPFAAVTQAGDLEILTRCALFLRLAEDLERSRDQVVSAVSAKVRPGRVTLRLDSGDEAVAVARWAAGRESELFARAFGRELVVR